MMEKLLLKLEEAGDLMGCGRSKAFDMVKRGEWETVETPYGRRVVAASLDAWIERLRGEQQKEGACRP